MIKLKEILSEYTVGATPLPDKPEKGHYIRDGKIFGKIVKFESWKGMKLAYISPSSGMHQKYKGGSLIGYEYKKLEISKLRSGDIERNVGKPIWVPK